MFSPCLNKHDFNNKNSWRVTTPANPSFHSQSWRIFLTLSFVFIFSELPSSLIHNLWFPPVAIPICSAFPSSYMHVNCPIIMSLGIVREHIYVYWYVRGKGLGNRCQCLKGRMGYINNKRANFMKTLDCYIYIVFLERQHVRCDVTILRACKYRSNMKGSIEASATLLSNCLSLSSAFDLCKLVRGLPTSLYISDQAPVSQYVGTSFLLQDNNLKAICDQCLSGYTRTVTAFPPPTPRGFCRRGRISSWANGHQKYRLCFLSTQVGRRLLNLD